MNRTPEQQWSALSALYEEADTLPAPALAKWLADLEAQGNPLLPQLKRMLEARAHLETDDFLGTLPKLAAEADEQASAWAEGSRVGPYRLVRPLGEGGMAEVWLAERADGAFKRQVAIKLPYPRPGRESFALRFDRERDILATLRHPHIAGLYDAGVTKDGQAWLALEYVEGQPISTYCDERRLPVRERVQLFRQVLLAVQHAHANLVIHRDLKPANILVTPQGEVRLLDFGIAKLLEAQGDAIAETELTRQAGRSMTPRYASPEQLTGLPLTTACDVYSLGVVFYELMCGERPYELKVESAAQLEHAILEVEPRAMSRRALGASNAEARATSGKALRHTLSPELDAIALRCLAKQASARYASVDAVLADLDRWLGGEAVLARAPSTWYRWKKFVTRHRLGTGLGVTAVLSLAVTAAVAIVLGMQAREDSARAVAARDFMLSIFMRADQEKARGADITARELLEVGRKNLAASLPGQVLLQAELLHGIGTIQSGMGEHVSAGSTFADAARLYAESGLHRETALALVAQADSLMRSGSSADSLALLQTARSLPRRPVDDSELEARMTEVEGWIANLRGESARAKDLFAQSREHASEAFGPYHERTLGALRGLIVAERQLGNFESALALQSELEAGASRAGDVSPKALAASDYDRARLLYSAGRYSDNLSHVVEASRRCIRAVGPNDERCRQLSLHKVHVLLRLGKVYQAEDDIRFVEILSEDATSPALQAEALVLAFRLASSRGDSLRQRDLRRRLQTFTETGADTNQNPTLKVRTLLALAEADLLAGDPVAAQQSIDRALTTERSIGGSHQPSLPRAVARSLAGVAALQRKEMPEALALMREGQRDLADVLGPRHALTQIFSLNVALALEALRRDDDALAVVAVAEPILRESLGTSSPAYQRVLRLKNRLEARNTAIRLDPRYEGEGNPSSSSLKPRGFDFFS